MVLACSRHANAGIEQPHAIIMYVHHLQNTHCSLAACTALVSQDSCHESRTLLLHQIDVPEALQVLPSSEFHF